MPTITIERYKSRFYASDFGEPPHVHVIDAEKIAKVWLQPVAVEHSKRHNTAELN